MLFVTEPHRIKVLAGGLLALSSFVAAGTAATLAASIGRGVLMAERVGIETSAWWTADGLAAIGATGSNIGMMGGTAPGISHATATLLAIGYSLTSLTITATLQTRRDVTR